MTNLVTLACWFGALWMAVGCYRGRHAGRFLAALVAGAGFAHLGWLGLNLGTWGPLPRTWLDLSAGYSVLLLPLGPLLLARDDPEAWRALPPSLVVARAGCLAAGCCGGRPAPWGAHPTPLYEMALLTLLARIQGGAPREAAGALFLLGFGLARLAVEPFRIPARTTLEPASLASAWVALGGIWAVRRARRRVRSRAAASCARTRFPLVAPLALLLVLPSAARGAPTTPLDRPEPARTRAARQGRARLPLAHHAARPREWRSSRRSLRLREWRSSRRSLRHPASEVRRAALRMNAALWDDSVLPELLRLEHDTDPEVRRAARALVRRYLLWGPVPPTPRQRAQANRGFTPYRPEAYRRWRLRGPAPRVRRGRRPPHASRAR